MRTLSVLFLLLICCPIARSQHKKAPAIKFDELPVIEISKERIAAGIRSFRQVKLRSDGERLDTSNEYLFRYDENGRLLESREYEHEKRWIRQGPKPPFDRFDNRIKKATQTNYEYDAAGNMTSMKIYRVLLAGSADAVLAAFRKSGHSDMKFWNADTAERQILVRPFLDSFQRTAPGDELLLEKEDAYSYDSDGNIQTYRNLTDQRETSYSYKYAADGAVRVRRSITRPRFRVHETHYTYAANGKPESIRLYVTSKPEDTMNIAQDKHLGFTQRIHYNKRGFADTILEVLVDGSRKSIFNYKGSLCTAKTELFSYRSESRQYMSSFETYTYNGTYLAETTTWHYANNKRTNHVTRLTASRNSRNLLVEQTTEEMNQYSGVEYKVEQLLSFYGNAAEDGETTLRRTRIDSLLKVHNEEKARKRREEEDRRAAQLKALRLPQSPGSVYKPAVRNSEPVFKFVEQMPAFDGDLQAYLSANLNYPAEAKSSGAEGRVIVQFIIQKDGSIVDVTVTRSSGFQSLDKEAMRVIRQMPKWIPGRQQGKAVNVYFTLPVTFRMG